MKINNIRKVLGVTKDWAELVLAMSELALVAIATRAGLTPAATELGLVEILLTEFRLLLRVKKGRRGKEGRGKVGRGVSSSWDCRKEFETR